MHAIDPQAALVTARIVAVCFPEVGGGLPGLNVRGCC